MGASREEAVYEPAWLVGLAIEALAEEPEAPPRLVLDHVVVACRLRFLFAPPFGADALRSLCMEHPVHGPTPAEEARRSLRHDRQHLSHLGSRQEQGGAGRRLRINEPVGLALHVAARCSGAFGNVAFDPPKATQVLLLEALRERVDEGDRPLIPVRGPALRGEALLARLQGRGGGDLEPDRLEAEAGIDRAGEPVEPEAEQALDIGRVAGRGGKAEIDREGLAVDAVQGEPQAARADPVRLELRA